MISGDRALEHYVALHSVGLARHSRKSYAECDFVIIGPAGIYCLEVKGGAVSRSDGLWTIGWPGKQYTSEEGPFKQAQSARGALLSEIRSRCGGDILRRIPIGWGVVFPDIIFKQLDPEWDQDCIFDERDRDAPFSAYLERLERYTRQHEFERGRDYPAPASRTDIELIVRAFRPDFDLVPRISGLLRDSRTDLLALSQEQADHLGAMMHPGNRRVICEGPAGTGKTVLAAECARRFAGQGKTVLFLCFNRNLAWQLKYQEFADHAAVTVDTIWRFLYGLARMAGCAEDLSQGDFHALAKAAEEGAVNGIDQGRFEPFDVLVIDEAQDVTNSDVMNALDWCVRDGIVAGHWIFFLDTGVQAEIYNQLNQELYDRLSANALNLPLTINMRNPRAIAAEASAYVGTPPPKCRRSVRATVDYRTIKKSSTVNRVARALLTDLIAGGAASADIVLLSFRAPTDAFFSEGFASIGREVQVLDGHQGVISEESFIAASIPAFKGLEADIVIIGDLPNELSAWHRASLYVALTRARTAAYVLCPAAFVDYRMELIGQASFEGDQANG